MPVLPAKKCVTCVMTCSCFRTITAYTALLAIILINAIQIYLGVWMHVDVKKGKVMPNNMVFKWSMIVEKYGMNYQNNS